MPDLVRVHIKNLRDKIEPDPRNPIYVRNLAPPRLHDAGQAVTCAPVTTLSVKDKTPLLREGSCPACPSSHSEVMLGHYAYYCGPSAHHLLFIECNSDPGNLSHGHTHHKGCRLCLSSQTCPPAAHHRLTRLGYNRHRPCAIIAQSTILCRAERVHDHPSRCFSMNWLRAILSPGGAAPQRSSGATRGRPGQHGVQPDHRTPALSRR